MYTTTLIWICGIFNLAFGIFHLGFWKFFKWESDLKGLSFANKGIIQILNVQIIYYFFVTAFICFIFPNELISSRLGNAFLISCSLFWLIRTIQQFIFLRANHFKIHVLTALFALGTILFLLPIFMV